MRLLLGQSTNLTAAVSEDRRPVRISSDWDEARRLLVGILDRNGFELALSGKRIRKKKP